MDILKQGVASQILGRAACGCRRAEGAWMFASRVEKLRRDEAF